MSHDFRSPLSSIIALAQGHSDLSPPDSLKMIVSIANYLNQFTSSLLASLETEARGSKIKMHYETTITSQFLERIKEIMSPLANQMDTLIKVKGNQGDMILTDIGKLTQIFVNFVGNSIKFTKKGTIFLKHKRISKDLVQFSVKDTGVGMTEETKQKLFVPFSSSGSNDITNLEGVGLGIKQNRCF